MILVTTSRRSTPVIRSIAKDLAFATGGKYLARGKHGLREIAEEHEQFIVIEQQNSDILMTLYDNEPLLCRLIKRHDTGTREGVLFRGIRTSDKALASFLKKSCPIQPIDDNDLVLCFDGPQKRCLTLIMSPVEIHDS